MTDETYVQGILNRDTPSPAPSMTAHIAAAIIDHFGIFYDPVLDAETALEYAGVMLAAKVEWHALHPEHHECPILGCGHAFTDRNQALEPREST